MESCYLSCLESCYLSCLEVATEHSLETLAFCSISTGVFRFPIEEAANIAVRTVYDFLNNHETSVKKVIFDVFNERDAEIYKKIVERYAQSI